MSSTTLYCACCNRRMEAGEAVLVSPTNGAAAYTVHRPGIFPHCFYVAGRREVAAIAEYDRAAAIEYDHLYSVPTRNFEAEAAPKPWKPRERLVWGRDE